jgi:hypothetical protein
VDENFWQTLPQGFDATISPSGWTEIRSFLLAALPRPPHRIKTGISAIFNAVARRIGPAAIALGRGVLSQSHRRHKDATNGRSRV